MKRLLISLLCAGVAAMAAAGVATAAKSRAPSHLLINAQEWSLWPSRGTVPAGTVLVELWNRGQDAHDSWIRRVDAAGNLVGPVLGRVRTTLPGHIGQATWHLRAGRYEIFCSMPGHMAMGMHTRLRVTPR